jgi:vitamin B12 transporter
MKSNVCFQWSFSGLLSLICAMGQSQMIDTVKNYLIDEVMVSATRYEKRVMEIPRSVSLITRQEIKNSGATNLAELLNNQESMNVIGSNLTPGSNQSFFMRGISGEQTVVMIDGIRISDPSSINNAVDLSEISLIDISRIEIVRGAHSTLYGSSAIGGVINLITGKGLKPGLTMNSNIDIGTFGAGSGQLNESLHLCHSFANGLYISSNIFHSDVMGLDAVLDTVTTEGVFKNNDRDDFKKTDLVTKAGYHGQRLNACISYKYVNQSADIDQSAYVNDENNTVDLLRNLFNYSIDYQLNDKWFLLLDGGGSSVARTNENDSSLITETDYDKNYYKGIFNGKLFSNEVQLNYTASNAKIVLGGGAYYESMTSNSYTYSGLWNYEAAADLDTLNLHTFLANAYVSADIDGKIISEKLKALSVMLGLRFNSDNRSGRYFTFEFNPGYRFSDKSMLFGSIASGFNSPSLYKLYAPEGYYLSGITRGNPALKPEKSLTTEFGVKQLIGKNLVITLSAYQNSILNSIQYVYLWDGKISIDSLGMDWMRDDYRGDTYLNLGRMTTRGIEFSLWAEIGRNLTVRGNMNLQQGFLDYHHEDIDVSIDREYHVQLYESGKFLNLDAHINRLSRRSNNFNLFVGYQITGASSMSVSVTHVGNRNDIFYSLNILPYGALDTKLLHSYTLYNCSFRQQINRYLAVSLRIQNLFNKSYTELLGYSTRGRGIFMNLDFNL